VGFVENDGVEGLVGKDIGVASEERIGRDDEVTGMEDAKVLFALGTAEDEDAKAGGEFLGLGSPIVENAFGGDDEAGEVFRATAVFFGEEMAEGLDGFTEAHVVGENATHVLGAEELEPAEPGGLVGAEGALKRSVDGFAIVIGSFLQFADDFGFGEELVGGVGDEAAAVLFIGERGHLGGPHGVQGQGAAEAEGCGVVQFGESRENKVEAIGGKGDDIAIADERDT
jgi:hypothetical protein